MRTPVSCSTITHSRSRQRFALAVEPFGWRTRRPNRTTYLVRLAPGKTIADALRRLKQREGPPPGEPFGGTTLLASGGVNFVAADFTPGDYALFCFAPDATDGKSHIAHGMIRQIQVK